MRQRIADDEWANKDGGDHYVTIPADQSVVKAVFTQGEGITRVLPYNTGFERDGANNAIHFTTEMMNLQQKITLLLSQER